MKHVIKRGLLSGLILAIWLIGGFSILKTIFLNTPLATLRTLTGLLGLVILFVGVLLGISKTKNDRKDIPFGYFDAVKTGVIISVTVAIVVSLASLLYVTIINPHFADDMIREAEMALKQSNASATEIANKINATRNEFSVASQMLIPLIAQTVSGTIFSLILGLFFRTKK